MAWEHTSLHLFQRLARSEVGDSALGEPVFLRCLVTCPPERVEQALAEALEHAVAIVGDRPSTLYTRGEAEAGDLHVVIQFRSGPCALVAIGPGEPACDIMLLSNRGAAYLDGTSLSRWSWAATGEASQERDAAKGAALLALVRRSLAEGQAVVVEGEPDG